MFYRILSVVAVIVFLATLSTAFAVTKTEKSVKTTAAGIGKVTAVKGNTITIRDSRGAERQYELNSAAGIKIGQSAWCEEDCGKGIKIGDKNVRVKKTVESR